MINGKAYAVRDTTGNIIAYHWSGEVAEAIHALERELTGVMVNDLPALEFTGTTLLRDEPLRRCGYFDTLPCIPLHAVPHSAANVEGQQLLSTASCFHVLAAAAMQPANALLVAFTCGSVCHRAEGGTEDEVLRLSSFRMRELVLVGEQDQVEELAEQALRRILVHLSTRLPKVGTETATDVFYGTQAKAMKRLQRAKQVKREVVTPWSEDEDYAVASWNLHGDRLLSAFSWPRPDDHSTCVAFGVERLAISLLAAREGLLPRDFLAAIRVG